MHKLIMISGVSELNDVEIGLFNNKDYATMIGNYLLYVDMLNEPEFDSYQIEEVEN
jgi:hypothetical protein